MSRVGSPDAVHILALNNERPPGVRDGVYTSNVVYTEIFNDDPPPQPLLPPPPNERPPWISNDIFLVHIEGGSWTKKTFSWLLNPLFARSYGIMGAEYDSIHLNADPFSRWVNCLRQHVQVLPDDVSRWDRVHSERNPRYIDGPTQERIMDCFFQLGIPEVTEACTAITSYGERMAQLALQRMTAQGEFHGFNLII